MRKLKIYMLVLLLGVPLSGCDDLLDLDINSDPDAATAVEGDFLFPYVLAGFASNRAMEVNPSSSYWAQIFSSQGGSYRAGTDWYSLDTFLTGNTWTTVYSTALRNLNLMRDQALAATPARPNVAAQGEIMMAYMFWYATSLWGEIPYTQALDAVEFPQPVFDDQETILRGLVQDLEDAVALIEPGGQPGVEFGDLIYGGDMADWEKFANSLRLRLLMMIRNQDPSVDAQIATLLNEPLIRTNADEAAVPFFDSPNNQNNMWKATAGYFEGNIDGQDVWYAGRVLVDLMNSLNDPRRDTYFDFAAEEGEYTAEGQYIGHRAGNYNDFADDTTSVFDVNIIRADWPSRLVTASEVWFYEAEYHAYQNNFAAAHTAYIEGVEAALDWFDGKPGDIDEAEKAAYIASLPASFADQTSALEAIWEQEYIEVLDRAPENWVHWKRTKHPAVPLPFGALLADNIRRMSYPPLEMASNPNAPEQQPPLDDPMWFEN